MDKTKKLRTAHRRAFTKTLNALNALRGAGSEATRQEIIVAFQLLEEKMRDLEASTQAFMDLLFDSTGATEEDIQKEYDEVDQYKRQFITAKLQFSDYTETREDRASTRSANGVTGDCKKSFKLPKIELAKFDGDVQGWLQFWSLFKKIHDDANIAEEDKFQYLIQSMVPDSRAADLVKSYPPTAENYSKVISSLKNRFGRDDLQIEVYVRELLQLVLQNALRSKTLSLTSLYDKIESHLRALESLGVTTDKCAAMLFPLVESSLPEDILRAWQRSSVNNAALQTEDMATSQCKDRLTQLIKFLDGEVQNELRISMAIKGFDLTADGEKIRRSKTHAKKEVVPTAMGLLTTKETISTCIFCNSNHESTRCENARKLSLSERREHAKKKGVCFNCLKVGHNFKQCRSKVNCSWCSRRHVLLMCPKIEKADKDSKDESKPKDSEKTNSDCNLANLSSDPEVLMQTLCVKLRNGNKENIVRAIIDTGSQKSYVTKEAADRLEYEPIAEQTMTHSLFGGQKTDAVKHKKYRIRLSSLDNNYRCNFVALDQAVICERVPLRKIREWDRELRRFKIDVSDRHSKGESISVLIGADVAGKLFTGRVHVLTNGLVAIETYLGWTIMGKIPEVETKENATTTAISLFANRNDIADIWSLDTLGIRDPIEAKTQKERDAEMQEAFLKTVRINEEGRYEIQLPWLMDHPVLPCNMETAIRRLKSTVRRLEAENLYADYNTVFKEWLAEGIIERVPVQEEKEWGYYLPHRHVVKESSTTRIRPVFDASAKERTSPSLNECLHKGPNLIELVASILLRFRENKIGIVADIKRAFLQISIAKRDRDFLRFLWYDTEGNIIVFRHCRVVFGISSSPFILNAIINLHLNNYTDLVKSANNGVSTENVKRLLKSFYVDNSVTSVNTREDLNDFISDAKGLLSMVGFDLRGWEYSNDNSQDNQATVLGVTWNKKADTLAIKVPDFTELHDSKITKRKILSSAHRIFDPLGFACPVMLCPRILLQETWSENLTWDEEVTDELKNRFLKWMKDLKDLNKIKITRCFLGQTSESDNVSLHIFCDASKAAYATVIFIRVENMDGIKVHFVQAKTRVAPARKNNIDTRTSIPRLELLAATIGARLARNVLDALNFKTLKLFYWTDSSTVLAWIQRENNWATFVYNRIKEIRMLSDPACWHHVQGRMNPADLPSRGCTVKQIMSARWWEGPAWLCESAENWPTCRKLSCNEDEINKELKKGTAMNKDSCTLVALKGKDTKENEFFNRFSDFKRMTRVFAYAQRFFGNCRKNKESRVKGALLYKEVQMSRILLLKLIQTECFTDETDIRVKQLNAFRDKEGLIRLSSKIVLRDDVYNFKCPIVLPGKHRIVNLIIKERHENLNHAGVEILMNALREEYWIIGGRKVIRSVITKCVNCRRHDAKPLQAISPPLPLDRVKDAAVFEVVGVDFTGPVYLKGGQKSWICLVTCAVFRAVHLELVTSLSTAAFLMAIRRFIARRGRPSVIYSDNGTNFVGLNNMFQRINFGKLSQTLATEQIQWIFNPPSAAWWGGFWERLNGILKRLLRRTLKKSCLDYEEMLTVLLDCEAVINSRPITFLSETKQEISPITPSMFLQEIGEIGVLDLDEIENCDLSKRYVYRQKIKENLRQRFRTEYLGALIHRRSNVRDVCDIKVGDIVIVENENAKRLDWPLARVKELIAGKDGHVRVSRLITAKGELVRPIQRLYPLELRCKESESMVDEIIADKCKNTRKTEESKSYVSDVSRAYDVHRCSDKSYVTRSGRKSKLPERLSYT